MRYKSWLGPFGTRSNSVSQRDGWRDIEVEDKRNYFSVRLETTTTMVDQYRCHKGALAITTNACVGGDNHQIKNKVGYTQYNHYKHGHANTLEDSVGDEPDALKDITTTVIACFGKNIQFVLLLQPSTPGVASEGGCKGCQS